ncbi:MAG TPA: phosphoribosylformylglycinamidine synthase, partial [Clostridiales bacterium]|nr:phosphoribosylformylglycinamidine synthase [Clostridiales bacterium]
NDFGAGGVCVAIGELSEGLDIDLNAVPKKYEGLDGTELAISESQERMAVVVASVSVKDVLALAAQENLEATVVAAVTDTKRMRLFWNGTAIVDISREFLDSNGATQHAQAKIKQFGTKGIFEEDVKETMEETLLSLLADLNICSKKGLIEMFDSTIGAASVTMPLGGAAQLSPVQAMCAKVPVDGGAAQTATLMSYGLDPYLTSKSPFLGAVYAVLDSVAKVVSAGGRTEDCWLTLQEYFERMYDKPERWGKPLGALLGAYWAQKELKIAAIGGKDSMSGSFRDIDVPPTLCSFCVAPVLASDVITPEFKRAGSTIYLLDIRRNEDGLPDMDDARAKYAKLTGLIRGGAVLSAWAVGRGGVLAGAAKCAMGGGFGVKLASESKKKLTRKWYGAIMVEAAQINDPDFQLVGEVTEEPFIWAGDDKVPLKSAIDAYIGTLEGVFPTKTADAGSVKTPLYKTAPTFIASIKTAIPRVVIPVFPGTNCEYDTAAAFAREGAIPRVVIMRNLSPADIEQSVAQLVSEIVNAQILAIPGGFSGGDEPDGSGKFIATTFRSKAVMDATMRLLKERDGLMLGICNGFQALIKLGLVPYGEIRDMEEDSPTLTFNTIGRHVSRMVRTRVTSVKSPWLMGCKPGEVHTVAVSHGEGRFVAAERQLRELEKNGQIATQYVDMDGNPSMDIAANPNGSLQAVEGIISPDGRVLGKMGHSERAGVMTAKNVPGEYDQKIFASGVRYFR